MYTVGRVVLKDEVEAFKWYRKAAEQGQADAQMLLANIYVEGIGVLENYKEAVKWYTKAAQKGHIEAQYTLGLMYVKGEGVEKNEREGYAWLLLSNYVKKDKQITKELTAIKKELDVKTINAGQQRAARLLRRIKANTRGKK
ncbi:MAG: sel1 repeat family protein [Aestuariibacter sp.]|nr:sel1 repeat family protein [Aestuariibacter sp.]